MDLANTPRPPHLTSRNPLIDRELAVIWQREQSWRQFLIANKDNPFHQLLRAAKERM